MDPDSNLSFQRYIRYYKATEDSSAQRNLAEAYETEIGVQKSNENAFRFYQLAANAEDRFSQKRPSFSILSLTDLVSAVC